MAKRRKKAAKRGHTKALALARRIMAIVPHSVLSGHLYESILTTCGVPADEARTIAGRWLLENSKV